MTSVCQVLDFWLELEGLEVTTNFKFELMKVEGKQNTDKKNSPCKKTDQKAEPHKTRHKIENVTAAFCNVFLSKLSSVLFYDQSS